MNNVIKAEHRFKSKKNRELDPILEEKANTLKDWFASRWPQAELQINFHFSRNVGEELEIKRLIRYQTTKTKHLVTSVTTIHNHTWKSEYLMEKFLNGFVQDQMRSITEIMNLKNGVNEING